MLSVADGLWALLFLAEGFAVGTLVHGGICLMGANQNTLQGTVICILAVMGALLNGTFNTLVCVTVHVRFLLCL